MPKFRQFEPFTISTGPWNGRHGLVSTRVGLLRAVESVGVAPDSTVEEYFIYAEEQALPRPREFNVVAIRLSDLGLQDEEYGSLGDLFAAATRVGLTALSTAEIAAYYCAWRNRIDHPETVFFAARATRSRGRAFIAYTGRTSGTHERQLLSRFLTNDGELSWKAEDIWLFEVAS
ncbi:MAG: hypothetical protein HN929_10115 [Chloroflexi bacterium]|mgnify:FL=1|nr:hypothetical protein [Chloroflexota bacterium]